MSYQSAKALLDKGVSRPTLFTLRLPSERVSSKTNDHLDIFCTVATIPEVRLDTVVVPGHENMGIVREQPTSVMFGKPFSITVIERTDYSTYSDIRKWLDLTAVNANQNSRLGRSQRMNYYNTFVSDMDLLKLEYSKDGNSDKTGYEQVMRVNFINAYPINIGQISLNTETQNTYTTYNVDFTYESYSVTTESLDGRAALYDGTYYSLSDG